MNPSALFQEINEQPDVLARFLDTESAKARCVAPRERPLDRGVGRARHRGYARRRRDGTRAGVRSGEEGVQALAATQTVA